MPQLGLVPYGERVRAAATAVFGRYGRHHRLSFCDAFSFVVVRTLLKNTACLAFDEDVRTLGLTVLP